MIARTLIEKIPSARWRLAEVISKTLYAKAFSNFGQGSVIVAPLKLGGLDRISIGQNVAVFEGVWLEAEPAGSISIGTKTYIGHRAHIHAIGNVVIEENVMITDGVTISSGSHDSQNHDKIQTTGDIHIGRNVFVGEKATVLGGVTIGDNAVIGAGAVVTKDVPAGATVGGVPARVLNSSSNA
ncbi:acyltransferase [Rothia terrae]|uniref:acyltransferase n=1 Tax=Rothia terrae TaxID=396015 RepID=UPI0033FE92A3